MLCIRPFKTSNLICIIIVCNDNSISKRVSLYSSIYSRVKNLNLTRVTYTITLMCLSGWLI